MTEPRTLVVTVGTSLFSSASWNCEGKLASAKGYCGWIEDHLDNPDKRRREGFRTAEAIEELLREGTEVTVKHFATDFDRPLRYAGEITTLLRYSQSEGEGSEGFAEFLRRRYEEIHLLAASDVTNDSNVAARHLQVILRDKLGHPKVTMPGLRSPYLREMLPQFQRHLANLANRGVEADLLITGGYKAFSLLAGKFVATQPSDRQWRALYIYEADIGQLIIEGRGETWLEGSKILATRWPAPVGEDD